ncbi:MAG: Endonuclease/Exonuclease/phosphatase family protein [Candidatus Izimaplasma bacterium HR2]|nr:MAG: Endonuclease/Exonuclease/phosphatase family protein [Candidatus Izimaplasma bacterium HR2]
MIYILIPLFIVILIPIVYILFLIIFEYKPGVIEDAIIINSSSKKLPNEFSVTTLNVGYCSLDKDNDFFFEGGKNAKAISEEKVVANLEGNSKIIKELNSDFYLIQEIDEKGSRSYNVNQLEHIISKYDNYSSSFAYNYRLKYMWYPLYKPMGSAYSGLLTLSKFNILSSTRFKLNGDETFPRRLFFLKRCMVVNTLKTEDNKDLYMINIHLSAYDKNGEIRKQQVKFLIEYLNELYDEDKNYIIIGGDWNHLLPKEIYKDVMPEWVNLLPEELYQDKFRLVYDKTVNTVRSEDTPYIKGKNFETVIDGFLVSPNVETVDVKTVDYEFEYTDHNPVKATFRLK